MSCRPIDRKDRTTSPNAETPNLKVSPMTENVAEQVRESVDAIYRSESRRILATLIRLLADFALPGDAFQNAFRPPLEHWWREGSPANPRAWLIPTARLKGFNALPARA